MRTFYTIDDLYKFCKENNFSKFSSKEHGNQPLVLQSIESFEADNSHDGLLDVKLKACHVGVNRNQSSISEDTMQKHMSSFKGRPILGSIFKADTGEYEFHSHDMEIDEEGNVEYIEQPVGVISQVKEPYLEYDKENDKTYLMVEGHIFEDYSKAAEILQRHKTCKCSVEIAVDEMSWNADENYLSIGSFTFRGVTVLGYEQDGKTAIEEGMKGSKITIEDFSEKNSMFTQDYQNKLLDTLEKLNTTLSAFQNKDFEQKGVKEEMNKLETLMEEYSVTMEDIDFEVEGLNDDELTAAFEEHFGKRTLMTVMMRVMMVALILVLLKRLKLVQKQVLIQVRAKAPKPQTQSHRTIQKRKKTQSLLQTMVILRARRNIPLMKMVI